MSDKEKKKKIVRASDASAFNRLRKKLGVEFLADKTDKELQAILDTPDSVFGTMKRQGSVGTERLRRKALTDKAYPDEILRNKTKKTQRKDGGMNAVPSKYEGFSKLPEGVQEKISPKLAKKYKTGGMSKAVMKKRGGTFKGTF